MSLKLFFAGGVGLLVVAVVVATAAVSYLLGKIGEEMSICQ